MATPEQQHYTLVDKTRTNGVIIATVQHAPRDTFMERLKEAIEEDFCVPVKHLSINGDLNDLAENSGYIPVSVAIETYTVSLQLENTWFY